MRLICPNCGAQYEVPDEVIPKSGRDVQCSDCGDTWYQYHPEFPPEPEGDAAATEPDWTEDPPAPPPSGSADTGLYDDDYGFDYSETETDETDGIAEDEPDQAAEDAQEDAPEDAQPATPVRRELDPSIRDVLREEAEREEQARQSELRRGGLETQQDLGIDEAVSVAEQRSLIEEVDSEAERRSLEARTRMARLRGMPDTDPADEEYGDIDPASRRSLLPDIEEINSSLGPERVHQVRQRNEGQQDDPLEPTEPPEKSAFRLGFRIAIVVAVVALVIYVFAPKIVQTVPALNDPLAGYVELVNAGRLALAQMVEDLAGSLGDETGPVE